MIPQMQPGAIATVQAQFDLMRAAAPAFAGGFYAALFALAPRLRPLFPAETGALERKLIAALAYVVAHLDRPAALGPVLRDMGARHAAYGATPADFAPVGEALFTALAAQLGAGFDPAARQAWLEAYLAVAGGMAEGLAQAMAAAAPDGAGRQLA